VIFETFLANFRERRKAEVRRLYLLDTWAELIGDAASAETQPHRLDYPTGGSAYATCYVPCIHLRRTDARDEALGQ
jgi:hypothetical protein